MTTTDSLNKRDVFSIANDLDSIRNHLRITQEMLMDLLCECPANDVDAMGKMHERIFLLVDQIPEKLVEMGRLNSQLLQVSCKEPAAA